MPAYLARALFVLTGFCLSAALDWFARRSKRGVARLGLNAGAGLALLFSSNTLLSLAGMHVGVNPVTVCVCAALGAPGAALLWGVRLLL